MTKYEVGFSNDSIKKVDIEPGTGVNKRSKCVNHFDTWKAAQIFIIHKAEKKMEYAYNALAVAKLHMEKVIKLRDPKNET